MTVLFLMASLVLVIDRFAKYLVFNNLLQDRSIEVVPNVFHLTLVLNTGAAFGFFKNGGMFFIVTSSLVVVLISAYAFYSKERDLSLSVALGLILGGAVGNLIDRLIFGCVIDFLDFRVWPVFNIADSCITIGAVLLALRLFFNKKCSTI